MSDMLADRHSDMAVRLPSLSADNDPAADRNSDAVYDYWYALYHALSTLDVDREDVRHSPEVISHMHAVGWRITPAKFDQYWVRVKWIADHAAGNVLEVGAGMGNVTRWIAANAAVRRVLAIEIQERYANTLAHLNFPKVSVTTANVFADASDILQRGPFDTVVMAEFIEHISVGQELELIEALRPNLSKDARWVLTTPVGFMRDPDHVRGFVRPLFRIRSRLLYGPTIARGDNGMQQFVTCRDAGPQAWQLRAGLVRALDTAFGTRPSGRPWSMIAPIGRAPRRLAALVKAFLRRHGLR